MPRTSTLSRSLLLSWLFLHACSPPPAAPGPAPVVDVPAAKPPPSAEQPPPPPAPPPKPGALRTDAFGGERWGFVEASSADGRFVVLRRFAGDAKPTFAHHGEASSADDLAIFDLVAGTERALDEIIDVEPSRRWMLLVEKGSLRLADARTGTFQPLDKADMEGDHNRCLPPRQANFSPQGKRVGWVAADGFRVRDLASGDEWVVKAKERLWRGWPEDDKRGATLAEVPAGSKDWPRQRTSCACRWCNRFALSYGTYGWDGPAFDIVYVAEDGSRTQKDPPEAPRRWHGKTDSGCTLEAKSEEHGLAHGPWQWKCPPKGG
jgi:hypothetical protein